MTTKTRRINAPGKTLLLSLALAAMSCQQTDAAAPRTFGEDAVFLKKHTDAVVLGRDGASIVVVPEYQGRVMTTTACGDAGASSGWINYDLVKSGILPKEKTKGRLESHLYAFGGEERFWMGPEGGQFAIFFRPGKPFVFEHWYTPSAIDTDAWKITKQEEDRLVMTHQFNLINHSGTRFQVGAERSVSLLDTGQIRTVLGVVVPGEVDTVAYQTVNKVTNLSDAAWNKDSGLLSIWLLSMFNPSPTTTIFIPYKSGDEKVLGNIVTSDYFGEVPAERLKVRDGVIYFRADGKLRGKIGLSPERSTGMAASYDSALKRLTLLAFKQPDEHGGYVNSKWEKQEHPYRGDAINSYNDGPVGDDGEQIGPFYELESSSPALALKPKGSATHTQTIVHFYGEDQQIQNILTQLGTMDLEKVKTAFK